MEKIEWIVIAFAAIWLVVVAWFVYEWQRKG
jgi:hypothetical protein